MATLHLKCSGAAKRRINALIDATKDYTFIGAMHPDDVPAVEEAFTGAQSNLEQFIARLEQRVPRK